MSLDRPTKDTAEILEEKRLQLEREKIRRESLRRDASMLLGQPEFLNVMGYLLSLGGMFRSVMTGSSNTYYLSGRQDYSREMFTFLGGVNPTQAFELLKPTMKDEFDD
jgi:hypothetical protein